MRLPILLVLAFAALPLARAHPEDDDKPIPAPAPFSGPLPQASAELAPLDPDSPPGRADVALRGDDARYALLRARLAEGSAADVLAVLDAMRAEVRVSGRPVSIPSGWLSDVPMEDAASKEEASILQRDLAEKEPWTVRVEAHFLRVRARRLAELLGDPRPNPDGAVRPLADDVAAALLPRPGADVPVRAEALGVDALDGQTVTIEASARVRYLQDYDVEMGMGGTRMGEPIVGALGSGMRLLVTPRRLPHDADRVRVDVICQRGDVRRPTTIFDTQLADDSKTITIQLPEVRIMSADDRVDAVLGSWVLVSLNHMPDETETAVALFRVRRTASPTRETPAKR